LSFLSLTLPEPAMLPISEIVTFVLALAVAGAFAGLLAGMFGIGGGAILVPIFFHVFGLLDVPEDVRMQLALGTSLALIVPTSIRSFMAHHARGAVDIELLKGWVVAVPLGTLLAAYAAAKADSVELRVIFALIALALAFRMIFNRA